MTDAELQEMRERDEKSAPTWFTGPASGPAKCFRDRRELIDHVLGLRELLRIVYRDEVSAKAEGEQTFISVLEFQARAESLLGIVKPTAPPIADFANRADQDEQQAEGENHER